MGRDGDERRIERLAEALERALRRLSKVDPAWGVYAHTYPVRSTTEMIDLHEAAQEHRSARKALDSRLCRACLRRPKDVPRPDQFHFVEHDLCADCVAAEP